jgi:hypothetical protein
MSKSVAVSSLQKLKLSNHPANGKIIFAYRSKVKLTLSIAGDIGIYEIHEVSEAGYFSVIRCKG